MSKKVIFVDDSKTVLASVELAVEELVNEGLIDFTTYSNPLEFLQEIESNKISYDIKKHYESYNCVVLGVGSDIQIDHKDGRKDDFGMPETQSINDFQPMHRNANTAKRQHCKVCKETNIRFDAKILGYKVSQWIGLKEYTGNCIGCYWFDPLEFNKRVSSSYIKER